MSDDLNVPELIDNLERVGMSVVVFDEEPTSPSLATIFIVAVYDCEQRYGGPEEGGWWYNSGQFIRQCKQFRSESKAMDYCTRLNKRLKSRKIGPNFGKRDYTSVLSDGVFGAFIYEDRCPAHFPDRKPHYE